MSSTSDLALRPGYTYSRLSISRSCWDYFLQVQITRSANYFALRVIWTFKKVSDAKLLLVKTIKMFFDSDRRFEFRIIRDIRVRDIESRLYVHELNITQNSEVRAQLGLHFFSVAHYSTELK